jgi:tetratricopeptide (TPR) repeat protein
MTVTRAERISFAALAVSILSLAWSASQAHLREDERIVVEAHGTDAYPRVTNLQCNGMGAAGNVVTVDLGWKVAIYNPSLQPVTATDITLTGITDDGPAMRSLLTAQGLSTRMGVPRGPANALGNALGESLAYGSSSANAPAANTTSPMRMASSMCAIWGQSQTLNARSRYRLTHSSYTQLVISTMTQVRRGTVREDLRKMIKTSLDHPELLHLAVEASARNEHGTAIGYLKQALDLQPGSALSSTDYANFAYFLGAEYAQIGMMERAAEQLRSALALNPALHAARFQLGLLLLTEAQVPQALEALAPLEQLSEQDAFRYLGAGLRYLAANDLSAGRQALLRGMELNGKSTSPNLALNADMQELLDGIQAQMNSPHALPANGTSGSNVEAGFLMSAYHRGSPTR